ncbi:MAG: cob(I)yrinic acid a,c-diamide adenosyltransferase [Hyphomonas sp.]|uniref:cob(I)yrinic acid a,c-diamide adenosyltransferase n=1 Tax=Hyphomonas sp. TaxID=87 RepID=UPI003528714D
MVKLDKIYTKTGDKGQTRLATGEPVDKWHPRVAAYGGVDEVNAALGVAALHAEGDLLDAIRRIQNDLFDLGADLATPDRGRALEWTPLRIVEAQVTRLETEIDAMNADIPPLDSFILPGGSPLAAYLHVARTLCRTAERQVAHLAATDGETVSAEALAYVNRLSDWLFVAGRAANGNGADDIKWVPGANR